MAGITFLTSGVSLTPGGSNGQVQFNDSGSLGGNAGLSYDKVTGILTVTGGIAYTPLNPLDWDSTPSNLKQAVDYLAAGSGSIAVGAVGPAQLATGSVQSFHITASAVGPVQIANNAVQSYHIASGAVGAAQIQNNVISETQLSLTVLNVLPSDTQAVAMSGSAGTPSDTNRFVTQQGGAFTGPVIFNSGSTFNQTSSFYSTTNFAPVTEGDVAFTVYSSGSYNPTLVTNSTTTGPTMVFYTSGAYNSTGSGQTVAMSGSGITFVNGPTYVTSAGSTTNISPTNITVVNPAVPTYPSFFDYTAKATSGGSINVSFLTNGGLSFGSTNPTGSLSGSLTLSAASAASGGGTTITSSGSQTGLIPLNLSASAVNVVGGGMSVPGGVTGDLYGTASYALNADLLDGRDSTTFAGLTSNTFSGIQIFNSTITGSSAYFSGDVVINGTASIAILETRNQQSLVVGDKYIVILSGAVDHVGLDGSGLLFGSGSTGPTVDENGANAYVKYRNTYDKLEIFPGLRVSGSTSITGNADITGSLTVLGSLNSSGGISGKYQTFSSNFSVSNSNYFCAINTSAGAVTASLNAASTFSSGQTIVFKDIGGFAGTTGKAIRINANGSDKIDGLSSAIISVSSGTMNITTDGSSNWYISSIF